MNQPQQQQMPTFSQYIKDMPFFYRLVTFSLLITGFISIFSDIPISIFPNSLFQTIYGYQIWRIFICFLFESSFLFVFLVNVNFFTFLPKFENKHSTIITASYFILTHLLIQVLCLLLEFLIVRLFHSQVGFNGILGIWLNLMYKFCYYNPAEVKLCCLKYKIQRRFYPFAIFVIVSLFQWNVRLQCLLGILLGVIECAGFNGSIFNLSIATYLKFQRFAQRIGLTSFQCWVRIKNEGNYENKLTLQYLMEEIQQYRPNQSIKSENDSFSGKKGIRLSDAD